MTVPPEPAAAREETGAGKVAERSVATRVHGTYLLRPPSAPGAPAAPAALLIGCHGYGETAADHLEHLVRIPGAERWLLCAVQALHPFYTRAGKVVASWMTRHDREHAIEDNVAYLAAVIEAVRTEHPEAASRVAYIGFSQGVAMAYRAAAAATATAGPAPRAMVALAGDVPPEVMARGPRSQSLPLPPTLIAAGRDDEWYDPGKMDAEVARLRERGVDARAFPFAGGHEWTAAVYERIGRFLGERLG